MLAITSNASPNRDSTMTNTLPTYALVSTVMTNDNTGVFFSWTSRLHLLEDSQDILDAYHATKMEQGCTLENARITSSSDPRFPEVWDELYRNQDITFISKFNTLRREIPDLKVDVVFQSEKSIERRKEKLLIQAQRMSEARAMRERSNVSK